MSQRPKRSRGVVLTQQGTNRLEAAIAAAQAIEKEVGKRFTQSELSDRSGLSIKTIRKIRDRAAPTDEISVRALFEAFDLEVEASDYGLPEPSVIVQTASTPRRESRQDLMEAPDASIFYGREAELLLLRQWIANDICRLVVLIGMGGIGKTALSVRLVESIQSEFDYCIWRSLREAPPVAKILVDLIKFVSGQQETALPDTVGELVKRLIYYLQQARCLLVLDNMESILEGGAQAGQYRAGYEGYGTLIQQVGELRHKSCLLITSREKPREVARLEGRHRPVRSYKLRGLEDYAGQEFLRAEGLDDDDTQWKQVFDYYSGNPLALKIAANTIQGLFGGNLEEFLAQGPGFFGDIRDLLEQQFERLPELGQSVMYWLAINREPTSIETLKEDTLEPISTQQLLETLESLRRRSLVERTDEGFTLQNVVMEYVTDRIIFIAKNDLTSNKIIFVNKYALLKAVTKDYIRETQVRLILEPILKELETCLESSIPIESFLKGILHEFKQSDFHKSGYLGGNILNLTCSLRDSLQEYDLSYTSVRQAYLRGVSLKKSDFSHAEIYNSVFTKPFGGIFAVKFNPSGNILATGDTTGSIRLWKIPSYEQFSSLEGHRDTIRTLAFDPTGSILASGSIDHTVKVWDIQSGILINTLKGHTDSVRSISICLDGEILASVSSDHTLRFWSLKTGECLNVINAHNDRIRSIDYYDGKQIVAMASSDKFVKIWDIKSGKCLDCLEGNADYVMSVAFNSGGQLVATGGYDRTVRIWNLATGSDDKTVTYPKTLTGHTAHLRTVCFQPKGNLLASAGYDLTVRLWELNTDRCSKILEGHSSPVNALDFSPDGQILATGSDDHTIRVWNVESGQCLKLLKGYSNWIESIAFSPDASVLATNDQQGSINLWDFTTGKILKTFKGHTDWVFSLAFSSDGKTLVSGSSDRSLRLWDFNTGSCIRILGHEDGITSFTFGLSEKLLISGSFDNTIKLWDFQTGQCLKTLQGHTDSVRSITVNPSGSILASCSNDSTIRVWDLYTGDCLRELTGHKNTVRAIVFLKDNIAASSSSDKSIKIWSIDTGECLKTISAHSNTVSSLDLSPDFQIFASLGKDRAVKIWEVQSQRLLFCLDNFHVDLKSVKFTPCGKYIALGKSDGSIDIWNFQTHKLVKIFKSLRPYEGMDITGTTGLTKAQRSSLLALGAIDHSLEGLQKE